MRLTIYVAADDDSTAMTQVTLSEDLSRHIVELPVSVKQGTARGVEAVIVDAFRGPDAPADWKP